MLFFCQTEAGLIRNETTQGIDTLTKAAECIKKLRYSKNRDMIDRFYEVLSSECPETLIWHIYCY